MIKRKLKPFARNLLYVLSIIMLVLSMYFIQGIIKNNMLKDKEEGVNIEDITNNATNEEVPPTQDIPVVNTDIQIIRPYTNEEIKLVRNYYDYQSDNETQEKSIIHYENTYMQNSGVDYAGNDSFDVVSILDGTVLSVETDNLLGTTVQIKHSNDMISVYQSMKDVTVKANDTVSQGTIIGKSGESNISKELGNHLHFELYVSGAIVNPENYFGHSINEFN